MQPVKNKKLTYLLICIVAVVWGIIIYRLFFNEANEDKAGFLQAKVIHEPYDQYVVKNDTFKLMINYRDPFLGKSLVAETAKVNGKAHKDPILIEPVPAPLDWSMIRYSGYITNPKTKKIISILAVNNMERMITEGESFQGVKLIKNKKDSILVSWLGKQKYIKQ